MARLLVAVLGAYLVFAPARTHAALGDCGQPRVGGPVASDALEILKTGVGNASCGGFDACVCDVNGSGAISASDALIVLRKAVGEDVAMLCPCTSSTTTTTLPGVTTEIIVLIRKPGSATGSDMAGTWDGRSLAAGPGAPWSGRATFTIQANGNLSGPMTGSDGFVVDVSAQVAVSAGGLVTCSSGCLPDFGGAVDSGKSVLVTTSTWNDGTTELMLLTKRGGSYSQSNLTGTWELNGMSSGADTSGWWRGALTIAGDGTTTGSLEASDGTSEQASADLSLSGTGALTCSSGCDADFSGALDSRKRLAAATSNPEGDSSLDVFTRRGSGYSLSNLAGAWYVNALAAGSEGPAWSRGTLSVQADGDFSGTIADSDGASEDVAGTFAIGSDGVLTMVGDDDFRCAVDADKTVAVCTNTW